MRAYALDLPPTKTQRRILHMLAEGAEIALYQDGTYRVRQTEELVSRQTLQACLRRDWISSLPGLPLFDQGACRLTPRGRAALTRKELTTLHATPARPA